MNEGTFQQSELNLYRVLFIVCWMVDSLGMTLLVKFTGELIDLFNIFTIQ